MRAAVDVVKSTHSSSEDALAKRQLQRDRPPVRNRTPGLSGTGQAVRKNGHIGPEMGMARRLQ
jgi:hypothetical protein